MAPERAAAKVPEAAPGVDGDARAGGERHIVGRAIGRSRTGRRTGGEY
jgi:hypothetical protein